MEDQSYHDTSFARRAQMRILLDLMAAHRSGARTLFDVGAGTGFMVAEARAVSTRWASSRVARVSRGPQPFNLVDSVCGTVARVDEWAGLLRAS